MPNQAWSIEPNRNSILDYAFILFLKKYFIFLPTYNIMKNYLIKNFVPFKQMKDSFRLEDFAKLVLKLENKTWVIKINFAFR